jgi:fucose 4-O-acetylase-like acetyltransferase
MAPITAPNPPVAPAHGVQATQAGRLTIDSLVDGTPAGRDRFVDFLRALSIMVVVLWHWVFSVTQWVDGGLAMPNPIGEIPGLWTVTWVLQIMPVFFFVGGYANLASWQATEARGGGWADFTKARLARLLKPIGLFVGLWGLAEVVGRLLVPGYVSVWHWGFVVFVPLWFLGVYLGVVLLAPVTARLHVAGRELTMVLLVAALLIAELERVRFDQSWLWPLTSALVWVFVHQLGYFWRDGTLTEASGVGRRRAAALTVAGFGGLVVLTNLGVYPRSMVSLAGESSNILPTTPCIAALAVFQLGIAMLVRPAALRWLAHRRPWTFTVAVNAVAMTIFTWHMTALVGAIGIYQLAGGVLLTAPTATWWAQRPLWLVLPGVLLAGLVALFARFELPRRAR